MMINIRRIIFICLALNIVLLCFSGCNQNNTIKIKFFQFETIASGDGFIEKTPIYKDYFKSEYEANMNSLLKDSIKEVYNIEINKINLEKDKKLQVDISENSEMILDKGSDGSEIIIKEIINTFINLPNVEIVEFTLEGNKNIFGNHYDLTGVFNKNSVGEIVNTK